jgi:hypothetical protein
VPDAVSYEIKNSENILYDMPHLMALLRGDEFKYVGFRLLTPAFTFEWYSLCRQVFHGDAKFPLRGNFARKGRSLFLAYMNTGAKKPCPLATFDAPFNTCRHKEIGWVRTQKFCYLTNSRKI